MPQPKQITLKLSLQDFAKLKTCLFALQDLFKINRLFDDSCARIPKAERASLDSFVDNFSNWILKHEKSICHNQQIAPAKITPQTNKSNPYQNN